jgi:hypothetical protein
LKYCASGKLTQLRRIIAYGTDVNCEIPDSKLQIPILVAVNHNNPDVLRVLLEAGADRELSWKKLEQTPLQVQI